MERLRRWEWREVVRVALVRRRWMVVGLHGAWKGLRDLKQVLLVRVNGVGIFGRNQRELAGLRWRGLRGGSVCDG